MLRWRPSSPSGSSTTSPALPFRNRGGNWPAFGCLASPVPRCRASCLANLPPSWCWHSRLGWLIGYVIGLGMVAAFSSDLYRVPFVIGREVFATASLVVMCRGPCLGLGDPGTDQQPRHGRGSENEGMIHAPSCPCACRRRADRACRLGLPAAACRGRTGQRSRPRTIEVGVEEEGEARIRDVFTISATIGGKLQRIGLHAGDPVVAQETVVAVIGPAAPALLDTRARAVAEAMIAAAQSAVDLARAQVAQADASLGVHDVRGRSRRARFTRSPPSPNACATMPSWKRRPPRPLLDSARANLAVREREL